MRGIVVVSSNSGKKMSEHISLKVMLFFSWLWLFWFNNVSCRDDSPRPSIHSAHRITSCVEMETAECSTTRSNSESHVKRPNPRRSPKNTRRRGGEDRGGLRSPSLQRCHRGTWECLLRAWRCPHRPASGAFSCRVKDQDPHSSRTSSLTGSRVTHLHRGALLYTFHHVSLSLQEPFNSRPKYRGASRRHHQWNGRHSKWPWAEPGGFLRRVTQTTWRPAGLWLVRRFLQLILVHHSAYYVSNNKSPSLWFHIIIAACVFVCR